MSLIEINQNDDWKNIMIETTYKSSASSDEKFLVTISNLINHFSDVIDVKHMLKYKIFTKFQTYFKNDLKKCDVDTIKTFTHQVTREIKIIKTTSLFNVVRTVINQKERFIFCIVDRLRRFLTRKQISNEKSFQKFKKARKTETWQTWWFLSKRQLISNEKSFSKFKKTRDIKSERRDDNQFVNKNMSLNISIKFEFYKNRRNLNFINENDFDQHTF